MRRIIPFLSVLVLFVVSGCGNFQRLGGKVVYSDDQSPIPGCQIVFTNGTYNSRGTTDAAGVYSVTSMKPNDGIPKGAYRVYIGGAETVETKIVKGEEKTIYTSLVDPRYRSPESSGLSFVADGKVKRYDIQLDRAPSDRKK